jgi:hypothetical protein
VAAPAGDQQTPWRCRLDPRWTNSGWTAAPGHWCRTRALVTGAAFGIDLATAQPVLQPDAAVVLVDVDEGGLEAATQALSAIGPGDRSHLGHLGQGADRM